MGATPLPFALLSLLVNTATLVAAQNPVTILNAGFGFTYIGCYNEIVSGPALSGASLSSAQESMTVEVCAEYCQSFTYMGVEAGTQCYCANSISDQSSPVTTESGLSCSDPQYACAGNANELCGGDGTYGLYAQPGTATTAAPGPGKTGLEYVTDSAVIASVDGVGEVGSWNYIGCYIDPGPNTRALNGPRSAYGAQDLEACAAYCDGYAYFGQEAGGECFCGETIDNGASLAPCQADCYHSCAANTAERCGGYYRLSMYEMNGGAGFVAPSETAACTYNDPETVVSTSGVAYSYYGPITTGSTLIPFTTTNSLNQTSTYTSTQFFCEGGCEGAVVGAGTASQATTTPTPTTRPSIGSCSYVGCYDDNGGGVRTLEFQQAQLNASAMTVELCVSTCLQNDFPYAGVEYGNIDLLSEITSQTFQTDAWGAITGSQCSCGYAIIPPHALVTPGEVSASGFALTCDDPQYACAGNDAEQCGGFATMDVYYCAAGAPGSSVGTGGSNVGTLSGTTSISSSVSSLSSSSFSSLSSASSLSITSSISSTNTITQISSISDIASISTLSSSSTLGGNTISTSSYNTTVIYLNTTLTSNPSMRTAVAAKKVRQWPRGCEPDAAN